MNFYVNQFKIWAKSEQSPFAKLILEMSLFIRSFQCPVIPGFHHFFWYLHHAIKSFLNWIVCMFYWGPLFQSRLVRPAPRLYLYRGIPYLAGPMRLTFGSDCRVSAALTITGRTSSFPTPELVVGNNVGIGWQTTISIGRRIEIGNNVRITGRCYLAGYPGHPLDAQSRALGLPDEDYQVGDIILEDDVWLASGVMVMSGVRIGKGTIVAAGSIVTRDLPSGVLAGGHPAKIIKYL